MERTLLKHNIMKVKETVQSYTEPLHIRIAYVNPGAEILDTWLLIVSGPYATACTGLHNQQVLIEVS